MPGRDRCDKGRDRCDNVLYVQRQKQETAANFKKKKGRRRLQAGLLSPLFWEGENPDDACLVGYIN